LTQKLYNPNESTSDIINISIRVASGDIPFASQRRLEGDPQSLVRSSPVELVCLSSLPSFPEGLPAPTSSTYDIPPCLSRPCPQIHHSQLLSSCSTSPLLEPLHQVYKEAHSPTSDLPDLDALVTTRTDDMIAARKEPRRRDGMIVTVKRLDVLVFVDGIPELDR
jgi:hypothetical protein